MSFIEAVKSFYIRYVDFEGRSSRSEYWWTMLFYLIVLIVFGLLAAVMAGFMGHIDDAGNFTDTGMYFFTPLILFGLAGVIPMFALTIRRFHDLNQTGWLVLVFNLLGAIPFIGFLFSIGQIIWFCMRGTVGTNDWGPDPLAANTVDVFD